MLSSYVDKRLERLGFEALHETFGKILLFLLHIDLLRSMVLKCGFKGKKKELL
jgi:hypothetical protein